MQILNLSLNNLVFVFCFACIPNPLKVLSLCVLPPCMPLARVWCKGSACRSIDRISYSVGRGICVNMPFLLLFFLLSFLCPCLLFALLALPSTYLWQLTMCKTANLQSKEAQMALFSNVTVSWVLWEQLMNYNRNIKCLYVCISTAKTSTIKAVLEVTRLSAPPLCWLH